VSEVKQSAKIEYEVVDTSKVIEVVRESLDVKLPVRSYPINVPVVNGSVHVVNSLYSLMLNLDSSTNNLTGVFSLPDTLLKGERTSLKVENKGITAKKKEETKFKETIKDKIEVKSVSWKTVAGVILVFIGIIVLVIRNYRKSRNL
jgi:hypothetical protein